MEGPNFLVINPDECIDCSVCVAECPVDAIAGEQELRPDQKHFAQLNRELSQHPDWKRITVRKSPLPGHEQWAEVKEKFRFLERQSTRENDQALEEAD
jgi:ferredoxin